MRFVVSSSFVIASLSMTATSLGADFNGDGYDDLAIGCPGEEVNGFDAAGAVHVLFGGPSCFGTFSNAHLTQATLNGIAIPSANERFGQAIACGDFDGDGFDDIAISAHGERVSGFDWAGAVFLVYGSNIGMNVSRAQVFHQDTPGVKDKVEAYSPDDPNTSGEYFGVTLAAGDFNGDGRDDLAVFAAETFGSGAKKKTFAGMLHQFFGSASGLTVKKNSVIHQNTKNVPGKQTIYAQFGNAMVVADFDFDGYEDLAVSASGDTITNQVVILRGSKKSGLTGKGSVAIDEDDAGGIVPIDPNPDFNPRFGYSLAVGNFDSSGGLELVISAPFLDVMGESDAGAVYVLGIDPNTLGIVSAQFYSRDTAGIDGSLASDSYFGGELVVGDFNANGYDDLAIGCEQDDVDGEEAAGSVTVLPGSSIGLTATDILLQENVPNMPGVADYGDQFGGSLAAGDYDGDGDSDLAIGLVGQEFPSAAWAGMVFVLEGLGNPALFDLAVTHVIDRTLAQIPGDPGDNDAFGFGLGH